MTLECIIGRRKRRFRVEPVYLGKAMKYLQLCENQKYQ